MLLLTEKETNAVEKQLKKSYEYEQQITQLTNNWNKLEEWLLEYKVCMINDDRDYYEDGIKDCLDEILDKMKEIKGDNNVSSRD